MPVYLSRGVDHKTTTAVVVFIDFFLYFTYYCGRSNLNFGVRHQNEVSKGSKTEAMRMGIPVKAGRYLSLRGILITPHNHVWVYL